MGKNKTARDAEFVAAMLHAHSTKEAAQKAGIPLRTAYDLASRPYIQQQIEEGRERTLNEAYTALKSSLMGAVAVLEQIAGDDGEKASTRAYAAQLLLQNALSYGKAVDTERRIAALEAICEGD